MRERTAQSHAWGQPWRLAFGAVLMLSAVCLSLPSPVKAEDVYLEALEDEASGLDVDPQSRPGASAQAPGAGEAEGRTRPPKSAWAAREQSLAEELPPGLARPDFEQALQDIFYGTYVFYRKLPDQKQEEVYRLYQDEPSVEAVRHRIIGMLKVQ